MKLKVNNYQELKSYVIANGDTPNAERCVVINIDNTEDFTMCFDDSTESVCVCEAYTLEKQDNILIRTTSLSLNNSISLVNRLIELSKGYIPTPKETGVINLYINEIEPASEPCEQYLADSISS